MRNETYSQLATGDQQRMNYHYPYCAIVPPTTDSTITSKRSVPGLPAETVVSQTFGSTCRTPAEENRSAATSDADGRNAHRRSGSGSRHSWQVKAGSETTGLGNTVLVAMRAESFLYGNGPV
eukprot:2687033-Rhodomonas_salina.2